jgi:hypothetical protein
MPMTRDLDATEPITTAAVKPTPSGDGTHLPTSSSHQASTQGGIFKHLKNIS